MEIDQLHRFSLEQWHRLVESGGLEDVRVELIDGLMVDMSPRTLEHEEAVAWLATWLFDDNRGRRFDIRIASALTLERDRSEPEPDLLVASRDMPKPYHYGTALLVIEVSVSSLRHDLTRKSRLYANAGIAEYWVVDVIGERVVRHLEPDGDVYRRIDDVRDTLVATAVELPALDLRELFSAVR
jgi:Uma2 family endonuclease